MTDNGNWLFADWLQLYLLILEETPDFHLRVCEFWNEVGNLRRDLIIEWGSVLMDRDVCMSLFL